MDKHSSLLQKSANYGRKSFVVNALGLKTLNNIGITWAKNALRQGPETNMIYKFLN